MSESTPTNPGGPGGRPENRDRPERSDRPERTEGGDRGERGGGDRGGDRGDRGGDRGGRGGGGRGPGGPRRGGPRRFHRGKVCQFCVDKAEYVDYKSLDRLGKFVSVQGKILPRRMTGTCSRHMRMLSTAIKRARAVALLPYSKPQPGLAIHAAPASHSRPLGRASN